MPEIETLVDRRAFLEGPRWYAGALYVSDMHAHEVLRVSAEGDVDVVARLETAPSGLGWLPDGRMLIASMDDRKVLRLDDGRPDEATDPLRFANGMVVTADQRTLVVAESAGQDLVGFDLADDGTLTNRRIWADLPDVPDGICIDAEDGVWIASPVGDRCVRVLEGGEVTDVIETPGRHAIACALGGDDGRTLFICTSPTVGEPDKSRELRGAKVETVRI